MQDPRLAEAAMIDILCDWFADFALGVTEVGFEAGRVEVNIAGHQFFGSIEVKVMGIIQDGAQFRRMDMRAADEKPVTGELAGIVNADICKVSAGTNEIKLIVNCADVFGGNILNRIGTNHINRPPVRLSRGKAYQSVGFVDNKTETITVGAEV